MLNTPYWKRIYHFFKVESTNDIAMQLGEEGEAHGAMVIAEEQTRGRGRVGPRLDIGKILRHLLFGAVAPADFPVAERPC